LEATTSGCRQTMIHSWTIQRFGCTTTIAVTVCDNVTDWNARRVPCTCAIPIVNGNYRPRRRMKCKISIDNNINEYTTTVILETSSNIDIRCLSRGCCAVGRHAAIVRRRDSVNRVYRNDRIVSIDRCVWIRRCSDLLELDRMVDADRHTFLPTVTMSWNV
jgi:hypothetical protein